MAKTRPVMRRKNMLIDQRKLDAAKAALGAETETAAVDAALARSTRTSSSMRSGSRRSSIG